MDTTDWLVLGGAVILMLALSRQQSGVAAVSPGVSAEAGALGVGLSCVQPGCAVLGDGDHHRAAAAGSPVAASPAYSCFLGNCEYQKVLDQYTAALNASNTKGTWDLSWQIAAQRDAWVKSIGG